MNKYVRLLRVTQWYKNLVIFLAIFFTDNIFHLDLLFETFLGFVSLCLVSSSYYIINDIRDAENDRQHPEKKFRPIASGEISVGSAVVISAGLLASSLSFAVYLGFPFLLFPLLLFASTQAYSFGLKQIALVDIHVIALNFLIRAVSGAVLIGVESSPWLISTVFFLALLLAISKRRVELSLLGGDAVRHKKVYEVYTEKMLDYYLLLVAAILLLNYSLYTFMVHQGGAMMITIPFATFIVFRYMHLSESNHVAARKTQLLFTDKQILTAFILWVLTSFTILHYLA